MRNSKIEWTEDTWNPVTGCTRVSAGCDHCYAARISHRLAHTKAYEGLTVLNSKGDRHFNGTVRLLPERLADPIKRKRPTTWFVNSMSDLFHERVPFEFIDKVMGVMALCQRHTFQVLTKRTQRMAEYLNTPQRSQLVDASMLDVAYDKNLDPMNLPRVVLPLPNVWFGTSIENQATADERIPLLRECPAAVRFLSCEPLLGPLDLNRYLGNGIDWVIVGGESGAKFRYMEPGWARSLFSQCVRSNTRFFMKQMSGKKEIPKDLMIREYPR